MPSGITAAIYEGKDVSLRDYLMGVGRQFGFAVMQRDDAAGEPLREVEPNTSYHDARLREARALLTEVNGLTDSEAAERAKREYDEQVAEHEKAAAKDAALRARYQAMIAEVEAWEPSALIASETTVKKDAIRYLRESLNFDCGFIYPEEPTEPLTGAEWIVKQHEKAQRDIDYHERGRAKEIERIEERNRFIRAFLDSLPDEQSTGSSDSGMEFLPRRSR